MKVEWELDQVSSSHFAFVGLGVFLTIFDS